MTFPLAICASPSISWWTTSTGICVPPRATHRNTRPDVLVFAACAIIWIALDWSRRVPVAGLAALLVCIALSVAVLGMLRSKTNRNARLMYWYLAAQMAAVVFFVCARYRITAVPVLLIFAGVGTLEFVVKKNPDWADARRSLGIVLMKQTSATIISIREALIELSIEQREVLVLKILNQMTFKEIAETVGASINTVAGRYRYGIEKLRLAVMG